MNETASLLLATTLLALGGLGLYMIKSSGQDDEDYAEDHLFGGGGKGIFDWTDDGSLGEEPLEEEGDYVEDYQEEDYVPERRTRKRTKTLRNKKTSGSRRRY